MTRISKKSERKGQSPRRCKPPQAKTGPKTDNLPKGYKEHQNALEGTLSKGAFIPKIR